MSLSLRSARARRLLLMLAAAIFVLSSVLVTETSVQARHSSANGPLVHLPADDANHPKVANEWWYIVGHLHAGKRTFGYQITAFRFSHVRPPGFAAPVTLYRSDVAITDETSNRYYHKVTYFFPQSVSLSNRTLNVRVGSIHLTGSSLKTMSLHASLPAGSFQFRLSSRRPPMYVGGRGYERFANDFTYYYSATDLATSGTLHLNGRVFNVSGISWLDRQWGNWSWNTVRGWTWMAWQLNNGVQLSVFDVRSTASHTRTVSLLASDGRTRTINGVSLTSTGRWVSPHDGAVYPSGWIVRIPALKTVMRVTPTVRDQEMTAPASKAANYWEGSSRLSGTYEGKQVSGLGYTELTGYVSRGTIP